MDAPRSYSNVRDDEEDVMEYNMGVGETNASRPNLLRPTFNIEAALSADVRAIRLRKGSTDEFFTDEELLAIENAAFQGLSLRRATYLLIAAIRSHHNLKRYDLSTRDGSGRIPKRSE